MDVVDEALDELTRIFRQAENKHEAHRRAARVLEQMSRAPGVVTGILSRYLKTPGSLEKGNFPVVSVEVALTPHYGLMANCWIPLPSKATDVTTTAIHHHGDLLLTTCTIFGPGYEHWLFSSPECVDRERDAWTMDLIEAAPHPLHHVAFVDAKLAHVPMNVGSLSITLALWSHRFPTSWRDYLKRLPFLKGREEALKSILLKVGLRKTLDLKVIEYFDFYPDDAATGFVGMRERKQYPRGPNEDHLQSVFHVLQGTCNEGLLPIVRDRASRMREPQTRAGIERLSAELRRGAPIEGRLSRGHYDVPYMNFKADAIRRALAACKPPERGADGRQFPAA